jgi:hypothetical protein
VNITLALLKSKGACANQVALFKQHFGEGPAPLDDATAIKMARVFDFSWAADNLLSEEGRKAYKEAMAALRKAYEESRAALWKAYEEAEAPLWKAYEEAKAPLWKAYKEAEAPLWKAYEEAKAPLRKAYEEAKALAFVNIARKDTP